MLHTAAYWTQAAGIITAATGAEQEQDALALCKVAEMPLEDADTEAQDTGAQQEQAEQARCLCIGEKQVLIDGALHTVQLYESQEQAEARRQAEQQAEYNAILLRILHGQGTNEDAKRLRRLERLLHLEVEQQARISEAERELPIAFERELVTDFLFDCENSSAPVQLQQAIARGKYIDIEDALIQYIDAARNSNSSTAKQ